MSISDPITTPIAATKTPAKRGVNLYSVDGKYVASITIDNTSDFVGAVSVQSRIFILETPDRYREISVLTYTDPVDF